ncbi:MAG TPA: zinc dependent phospholipase C family protein [Sediminibacterium sp.]|nr:zinc dependent phospholipase C family protein [Sediminibacterium sp.]
MTNGFRKTGLFIVMLVILTGLSSWGFLVHKTVQQLAIYQLPAPMIPLFYGHADQLIYDAVRPDIRRNNDSAEAPKHFIDLEDFGKEAAHQMPLKWEAALEQYGKDSLLKYGYVPYQVVFLQQKLTEAFREKNRDSILFYAADMGHYIADAHVPLHTTNNYDGQLTGQNGLHSLWETMVPEIAIGGYQLATNHQAQYLKEPAMAIWKAVRHANALLPDVLAKEKEVSQNFTDAEKYRIQVRKGKEYKYYTSAFAKAYGAALKTTVNDQLLASAELTADFWFTSWVNAGKPDLSAIANWSEAKKTAYEQEYLLFRKNELLQSNKLQAKKTEPGAR